jgi:hypothetical protein
VRRADRIFVCAPYSVIYSQGFDSCSVQLWDELTQFSFFLALFVVICCFCEWSTSTLHCTTALPMCFGSFWVVHFGKLVTIVSPVGFGFGVDAWRGQAGRRSEQSLFS